jgi:hypothetical protein
MLSNGLALKINLNVNKRCDFVVILLKLLMFVRSWELIENFIETIMYSFVQ